MHVTFLIPLWEAKTDAGQASYRLGCTVTLVADRTYRDAYT